MPERLYDEDEVRQILDAALRPDAVTATRGPAEGGLTLAEVQSIALEVGVAPARIAEAAATLDVLAPAVAQRSLGMPVGVGVTMPLRRDLSEREWDQLVAELRATFGATGTISRQGSLRQWANGNLRAAVEPAGSGYRLRLSTVKGNAALMNLMGSVGVGSGAIVLGASALSTDPAAALFGSVILAAAGGAAIAANFLRLRGWTGRREREMQHIEAYVLEMMRAPAAEESPD